MVSFTLRKEVTVGRKNCIQLQKKLAFFLFCTQIASFLPFDGSFILQFIARHMLQFKTATCVNDQLLCG